MTTGALTDILGVLALGIVLALATRLYARHRRWTAVWRLYRLQRQWQHDRQLAPLMAGVSRLLRQTAMRLNPRPDLGGLHGSAWLAFLDDTGHTRAFTRGVGRLLIRAPYQDERTLVRQGIDVAALLKLARSWLLNSKHPQRPA